MNKDAFKEYCYLFWLQFYKYLSIYLTSKYLSSPIDFSGRTCMFKGYTYVNICRTENSILVQILVNVTNGLTKRYLIFSAYDSLKFPLP